MKKTILPLLLFSFVLGLSGTNNANNHLSETATDLFTNKTNISIRKLDENTTNNNEISYSKMYTQYAKKDNKYYLRFAAAIKGDVNSINFVREIDGLPNKDKECTTLYKGISANNKTLYYDGANAIEESSDLTNDYYWACYTIQFNDDTYLNKDIKLSMYINNQETSNASKSTTLKYEPQVGVVSTIIVTKELNYSYLVGEDVTFEDLQVSTIDLNDNPVEIIDNKKLTFYENNQLLDLDNLVYYENGNHTVTIKYEDYCTDYSIAVAENVYDVEAENVYFKDEKPDQKNINYIERVSYAIDKEKKTCDLKPVVYGSKPEGGTDYAFYNKDDAKNSSGQAYLGEIKANNKFNIHIFSGVERVVKAYITASSGVIEKDIDSWQPVKMADIQLNKMISATANGEKLSIADDVILKGGETQPDENGNYKFDPLIWTDYYRVCIGELVLNKGDNIVEVSIDKSIKVESSITKNYGTINIDKFDFVDVGMRVEAECIANKNEKVPGKTNYVERVNAHGNQLGAMLLSNGKDDAKYSSNKGYLGEIKGGNSMNVHIWSEKERLVEISMTAASGVITVDSKNPWKPYETADIQLNKLLKATANGNNISIDDNVILPGTITPFNEDGTRTYNPLIWTNWKVVDLGIMRLKKGDNIIYVELTNAIAFTGNITKSYGTINIDKFDVKYLD